jgi:hypothetical protein
MAEEIKINFRDRLSKIGCSKYVLVPAKLLKLEGVSDSDVLNVTITVNPKNE